MEPIATSTDAMLTPVTDINRLTADLETHLARCLGERRVRDHDGALSITLATPELGHLSPRTPIDKGVYWARPGNRECAVGSAPCLVLETFGRSRFNDLEAQFESLRRGWLCLDPEQTGLRPHVFLGFSFAPDYVRLALPAVLYQRRGGKLGLSFSCGPGEGADPARLLARWSHELAALLDGDPGGRERAAPSGDPLQRVLCTPSDAQWAARVEAALRDIERGWIDKVVISRRVLVQRRRQLPAAALVGWLEREYPSCAHFALGGPKGTLVGASPERLVTLRDGLVTTDAVAGTAARGRDSATDARLGADLRASDKDLREHRLVVDDLLQALGPLCAGLNYPTEPQLMQLTSLRHLWTPIRGRARPGVSLIGIASRLHPTAAVGGAPRERALAWLAEHEPEPRGWYTGALGWMAPDGGGELLRRAALRPYSRQCSGSVCRLRHRARLRPPGGAARNRVEATHHAGRPRCGLRPRGGIRLAPAARRPASPFGAVNCRF